jgi:hypothetical protein
MVIVMLLTATTASGVAAKGRPMRAAVTQAGCGSLTVQASWWKKLTVRSVQVSYSIGGPVQGIFGLGDDNGFASPVSIPVSGLPYSAPTTTYSLVVSLYADTAFPGTQLIDSTTAEVTLACSV